MRACVCDAWWVMIFFVWRGGSIGWVSEYECACVCGLVGC